MKLLDLLFGKKSKGTVSINGKTYVGNNVSIVGDTVYVDGRAQSGALATGQPITVNVTGDVARLDTACGDVNVTGCAGQISCTSGDIQIAGGVAGNVESTSGDVSVGGSVGGSVSTVSGDVRCRK